MASETLDLSKLTSELTGTAEHLQAGSADSISADYWSLSRHPLPSLVFLLPLLLIYEWGVLSLSRSSAVTIRNGADIWMRAWLQSAGFGHALLLPTLVVVILLTWHVCGRYPWRVCGETLMGMLAESLLFAFVLIIAGQLQDLAFRKLSLSVLSLSSDQAPARIITFIGAGVYEEVLFRLCLLPACYVALRTVRCSPRLAAVAAVFCTGMVFAGAHYIGPHGEAFNGFTFTFRATAGLFFAGLFYLRGFGITVGCHAAYDLLVGVILIT